ncbi:MAG: hypothetical protein KKC37_13055 [Proteobacteria bacterium]|nr:hypothetical protein [Pseudomonadota bacterium]
MNLETIIFKRDEAWPMVGVWSDGPGEFSCFEAEPDDEAADFDDYRPANRLDGPFPDRFQAEREARRLAGRERVGQP